MLSAKRFPLGDAQVAAEAIAADLNLLEALEAQIELADQQLQHLLRLTRSPC